MLIIITVTQPSAYDEILKNGKDLGKKYKP